MSWKDIGFVSIVLAAALSGLFLAGEARPSDQGDILPYVPGEVLVKFKDSADPASRALLRKSSRARLKRMFSRNSIELLKLEGEHDTETTVKALQASPLVQYAEPNWRVVPLGRVVPGDEYFPRQWPLDAAIASTVFLYDQLVPSGPGFVLERVVITVGDSVIIGTQAYDVDVDIDAPEAWAVLDSAYSGTLGGTVGVIDSGLSETGTFDSTSGYTPDHEDFPSSLFVNTAESSGLAGIDDDLNGYIDDVNGWDWYTSDDASLPGSEPDDDIPGEDPVPADSFTSSAQTNPDPTDYSHGTLVSGIFSAGWDNGAGVASVGQNRLGVLPLRTYLGSDSGIGDIVEAIGYAAVMASNSGQIRVLNASWRLLGNVPSTSLKEEIEFASSKGILFVAAAGNSGEDNDQRPVYPASHSIDPDLEGAVIAVGATSYDGDRADFSNYGETSVQIGAPGVLVLSTGDGSDGYYFVSGTSFATPIVAGVAGLLAGAHPSMSTSGIMERIVEGGVFDEKLAGVFRDGKRLNMTGALAPFHPFSGLAFMDTACPVSMYGDAISSGYGSILAALPENPSVAVMKKDGMGAWAVSPIAPGITSFELAFTSGTAPVPSYRTGPWRVTAISPFEVREMEIGETVAFSTVGNLPGTITWEVENPSVGSISFDGIFQAEGGGSTRVILLVNGTPYDASARIDVSGASPGGGGGCGTILPPGDHPWTGLTAVILVGSMLMATRRRWLAGVSPEKGRFGSLKV